MNKSLLVDTTLFKNQQVSNIHSLSSPVHCRQDILSFENQTIPSVVYSSDIFEKQSEKTLLESVYIANDGKKYNIKEILSDRIRDLHSIEQKKIGNIFSKFVNYVKETFNIGNTYKKFQKSLFTSNEILNDETKDVSELFLNLTGFEYNNDNIELFLMGSIKLKTEVVAEKYTGKSIDTFSSPYISKYYISEKSLNELKNSRIKLNEKEIEEYNTIEKLLPAEYQQKFINILNNGQLLQNNSEGNVTILSSLYKIATEDRADKIDKIQLLKDCIDILDNPYVISQNAEDIPEEYQNEFSERLVTSEIERQEKLITKNELSPNSENLNSNMFQSKSIDREKIKRKVIDERVFQYRNLGTCAAASIEFELATKYPADFFRMVEGLTAKNKNISKNVKINDYNKSQLTLFNTTHKIIDDKQATVTISADENAYLLAEIQNKYKDEQERSIVDIIMQSAIMNLGSRQTYNSIDDTREPNELTENNGGLIDLEISFAREVLTGQMTYNNRYKKLDNNGVISDLYKQENVKNEILGVLQKRNNVIVGIVYTDENNRCVGGHEVTIIGYTTNLQGQGFFIIQDSDDAEQKPITMPENQLLKKIHHAIL
ncbi:hypothetical protein J6R97_02715 [bacterium]|nr:hypothetical protein [bacterium]